MSEPLQTALQELAALRSDLPRFDALLSENKEAAANLKAKGAPLEKQLEAKTRVSSARELLEQHHVDIETAETEVSRLEQEAARQRLLSIMEVHSKDAQALRTRYTEEMAGAVQELRKRLEALQEIKRALGEARTGFYTAGRELAPEAFAPQSLSQGLSKAERETVQQIAAPIVAELEECGADLSFILTPYNPTKQYRLDDPRAPHRFRHTDRLESAIADLLKGV